MHELQRRHEYYGFDVYTATVLVHAQGYQQHRVGVDGDYWNSYQGECCNRYIMLHCSRYDVAYMYFFRQHRLGFKAHVIAAIQPQHYFSNVLKTGVKGMHV